MIHLSLKSMENSYLRSRLTGQTANLKSLQYNHSFKIFCQSDSMFNLGQDLAVILCRSVSSFY